MDKDADTLYDKKMQTILDDSADKVERIRIAISGKSFIYKYKTTDKKQFNSWHMATRHQYELDRGMYESN